MRLNYDMTQSQDENITRSVGTNMTQDPPNQESDRSGRRRYPKLPTVLILTLTMYSCGKPCDLTPFKATLDSFQADAAAQGKPVSFQGLTVEVTDDDPNFTGGTIGLCYYDENMIHLKASYWNNPTTTDESKKTLLYHELGHCILGRVHLNRTSTDCSGISIMNPIMTADFEVDKCHDILIKELFK